MLAVLNAAPQPVVPCNKRNGLYHERFETDAVHIVDEHDVFAMDCEEAPRCMSHCRYNEESPTYKHHYCCKYNRKLTVRDSIDHFKTKWLSNKFVCFKCRNISKRKGCEGMPFYRKWPTCRTCNKHMENVGVEFAPPSKSDKKHWAKLDKEWYAYSRMTYSEYKTSFLYHRVVGVYEHLLLMTVQLYETS